jgi:transcriptional regulator with XRE-family HTH domain
MAKQFSDQLRRAVLRADVTRYRIAQDTGISEPHLSRFVRGQAGLSMQHIDTLMDYLGLTICKKDK